jgi:hypothetical protein
MCEHERCESDRHDGHVVQVSPVSPSTARY